MGMAEDFAKALEEMERHAAVTLRANRNGESDAVPTDEEFRGYVIDALKIICMYLADGLRETERLTIKLRKHGL
jgi:hypothetical protein